MGGQDGYARDPLSYDSASHIIMAGLTLKPADKLKLGLNLTWTESEAALAPFDLSAPDYVATHPSTQYDFSQTHTYSDLDLSRLEASVKAGYKFSPNMSLYLKYRYADFDDDAPYLYDTSGSIDIYTAAVSWSF
jgi:predicted porin